VNLQEDFRCGIHARLRESGFKGCTVFDCFGAGQKASQVTFAGHSWRENPAVRQQMFAVFPVLRQLQELLWYLSEAASMPAAAALLPEVERMYAETERMSTGSAEDILHADVAGHRESVNALLMRVADLARRSARPASAPALPRRLRRGADLLGARLAGRDLRGASLRGACLIAADLSGTNLTGADLIGADLRDAELAGANLSGALFVTQAQLNAAHGDDTTVLPPGLRRPAHWRSLS
jgi:uncharacterized protein YjbI with pentapeptide repeats